MDHHDIPPGLAGIMGISGFSTEGDSKNHMDHLVTGGGGSWSLGGLGKFGVGADGMGGFGGSFHSMHGFTRSLNGKETPPVGSADAATAKKKEVVSSLDDLFKFINRAGIIGPPEGNPSSQVFIYFFIYPFILIGQASLCFRLMEVAYTDVGLYL